MLNTQELFKSFGRQDLFTLLRTLQASKYFMVYNFATAKENINSTVRAMYKRVS